MIEPLRAPHIEYGQLAPILIVLGFAALGIVAEAAAPRQRRFRVQVTVAKAGLIAALVATGLDLVHLNAFSKHPHPGRVMAEGAFGIDGPALVSWALILVFAILGVLLFAERRLEGGVTAFSGQAAALPGTPAERDASTRSFEHTEVFPLLLFAVSGMLMFSAANDLLTSFVALEVLSLPLYLLCALARRRRLLSQEAALKYFLLGAFSSGFFVYGIALVYGFAGALGYNDIAAAYALSSAPKALLFGGIALVSVGLLFKVGAAPFQAWTPDVYQGAPTALTAFMAAGTKVAAFAALLRLFFVAFGSADRLWMPMMWIVALLTMAVGSVIALTQDDVKRLLAYSSIAHAGFLLVGFLGVRSANVGATQAVLFYLVAYGFMTMAAFALVTVVRDSGGEQTSLDRWRGLGRRSPLTAWLFAYLLLAMAGVPLTSGFIGKWSVFAAALSRGAWPLVVAGVLFSAIALAFYVRIIVLMFFAPDPSEEEGAGGVSPLVKEGAGGDRHETELARAERPSVRTSIVIAIGVVATFLLAIVPGPLLTELGRLAVFVR